MPSTQGDLEKQSNPAPLLGFADTIGNTAIDFAVDDGSHKRGGRELLQRTTELPCPKYSLTQQQIFSKYSQILKYRTSTISFQFRGTRELNVTFKIQRVGEHFTEWGQNKVILKSVHKLSETILKNVPVRETLFLSFFSPASTVQVQIANIIVSYLKLRVWSSDGIRILPPT